MTLLIEMHSKFSRNRGEYGHQYNETRRWITWIMCASRADDREKEMESVSVRLLHGFGHEANLSASGNGYFSMANHWLFNPEQVTEYGCDVRCVRRLPSNRTFVDTAALYWKYTIELYECFCHIFVYLQ